MRTFSSTHQIIIINKDKSIRFQASRDYDCSIPDNLRAGSFRIIPRSPLRGYRTLHPAFLESEQFTANYASSVERLELLCHILYQGVVRSPFLLLRIVRWRNETGHDHAGAETAADLPHPGHSSTETGSDYGECLAVTCSIRLKDVCERKQDGLAAIVSLEEKRLRQVSSSFRRKPFRKLYDFRCHVFQFQLFPRIWEECSFTLICLGVNMFRITPASSVTNVVRKVPMVFFPYITFSP